MPTVSEEEVEAAMKRASTYVVGGWEGHWNICTDHVNATPVVVEVVESSWPDAMKRALYLNTRAALEAAAKVRESKPLAGKETSE